MVSITAELFPPVAQAKSRRMFAFGLVKVKLDNRQGTQAQPADELNVLGLLVFEDPLESDRFPNLSRA